MKPSSQSRRLICTIAGAVETRAEGRQPPTQLPQTCRPSLSMERKGRCLSSASKAGRLRQRQLHNRRVERAARMEAELGADQLLRSSCGAKGVRPLKLWAVGLPSPLLLVSKRSWEGRAPAEADSDRRTPQARWETICSRCLLRRPSLLPPQMSIVLCLAPAWQGHRG